MQTRAGDVEIKTGVFQGEVTELPLEDDVVGRPDAVKNSDLVRQFATRGFAGKRMIRLVAPVQGDDI